MSVDTVTTFFALLAVLALASVVLAAALWAVVATTGGPRWALDLRDAVAPVALPLACGVALTCTLGSLYLSEVAGFPPCELCWYQRIAMYPMVVLTAVAAIRRDRTVWTYVVPLGAVGAGISIYHYLVERFPGAISTSCDVEVPCSTVWVWKFHFLSIPAMAGAGFALIMMLALVARSDTSPHGAQPQESGVERQEG